MRHTPVAILTVLLSLVPSSSVAQWVEGGVPLTRDPTQLSSLVTDGAGGVIAVWSGRPDFNSVIVFARRLTVTGELDPAWPDQGTPLCQAPGFHFGAKAASDGSGGAVAVWRDTRNSGDPPYSIYANHVVADGTIAPGWPADGLAVCPDSCTYEELVLAADGSGGGFVGWSEAAPARNVRVQHVTSNGAIALGWPVEGLIVGPTTAEQHVRTAVPDGAGGVYIGWDDFRLGYPEVYAQHVMATGNLAAGWPVDGLLVSSGSGASAPVGSTMCSDGAGGAIVFWREGTAGNPFDWTMRSKHVASDGSTSAGWVSPEISNNAYSSDETPTCSSASRGGAFVAWIYHQTDDFHPARVQKVSATGERSPGWPDDGVLLADTAYTGLPALAPGENGSGYVAWTTSDNVTSNVMVQHLTPDGLGAPGWIPGGTLLSSKASGPEIIPSGAGGAIVAWSGGGIYAQRVDPSGVNSFAFAAVGSKVDPDLVRLMWQATAPWVGSANIYRRSDSGWSLIATAVPSTQGGISFEDHGVSPGGVYAYRVGVSVGGVERFYGEVQVQVPLFALTMRPVTGNPVRQQMTLTYTLPTAAAAKLETFDVRGRLMESRDVGSMGVGRHTATFQSANRPASGVYIVKLSQGGESTSSKITVLR